jgi:hypothetical protein
VTNICDSDATEQILWTDLCEGNFWCGPGSIRYFLCFFKSCGHILFNLIHVVIYSQFFIHNDFIIV